MSDAKVAGDAVAAALWEGSTSKCACGRRRRKVDGNAPTVCNGCDNFPWNCRCAPRVGHRSGNGEPAPSLDPEEEEF